MPNLDPTYIRESLRRLAHVKPDIFGANGHRFKLNPPLSESEVAGFEKTHRISLPKDYRRFITEIGNGGAGPYYGVFPLAYMDDEGFALAPWDNRIAWWEIWRPTSRTAAPGMTSRDTRLTSWPMRMEKNTNGN